MSVVDQHIGKGMVGKVKGENVNFEKSGTASLQVTVTLTNGRRLRISEGMMAFANAEYLRPGDIIQFEFTDIEHGKYWKDKDGPTAAEVPTTDYMGIGELSVIEIGTFSDTPDEILIQAGRKQLTYTSRTVGIKTQEAPPPQKPADQQQQTGSKDSPFEEEGH